MCPQRRKHSILLVNGTATVQNLRLLMLRMRGYTVHGALSLNDARQLLTAQSYSLVIVDVGHYAEPGLKFCEEARTQQPHVKVMLQVEDNLLPLAHDCPDKVVPKQEGPHAFVSEVEKVLAAAGAS
jgi:DNA-binding NtrC family response regulator